MVKQELVAKMVEKTNVSKKDAKACADALFETIKEELAAGGKVQIAGFGNFEITERKARMGRNPKTNEEMPIPGGKAPKFKASKALKEIVATGKMPAKEAADAE